MVLGAAPVGNAAGIGNIEAFAIEPRTEFGGNNDSDNSGVLRYISVRHAGAAVIPGFEVTAMQF